MFFVYFLPSVVFTHYFSEHCVAIPSFIYYSYLCILYALALPFYADFCIRWMVWMVCLVYE